MPGDILVQTVSTANIPVIFIKLLSFSPDCVSVSVGVIGGYNVFRNFCSSFVIN